jgi:K+-sensing histidine kinase KdpD
MKWIDAQPGFWYLRYKGQFYFNRELMREFNLSRRTVPVGEFVRLAHPDDVDRLIAVVEECNKGRDMIVHDPVRWQIAPAVYSSYISASCCVQEEPAEIYVGHAERMEGAAENRANELAQEIHALVAARPSFQPYMLATAVITLAALFNWIIDDLTGIYAEAMIFMTAVVVTMLLTHRKAAAFAALIGALVWDFFFLPPRFALSISSPQDWIVFVSYCTTSALLYLSSLQRPRQESRNPKSCPKATKEVVHT